MTVEVFVLLNPDGTDRAGRLAYIGCMHCWEAGRFDEFRDFSAMNEHNTSHCLMKSTYEIRKPNYKILHLQLPGVLSLLDTARICKEAFLEGQIWDQLLHSHNPARGASYLPCVAVKVLHRLL